MSFEEVYSTSDLTADPMSEFDTVFIRQSCGKGSSKEASFKVSLWDHTVWDLKQMIGDEFEMSSEDGMKLVFGGNVLSNNEQILANYMISNESLIELVYTSPDKCSNNSHGGTMEECLAKSIVIDHESKNKHEKIIYVETRDQTLEIEFDPCLTVRSLKRQIKDNNNLTQPTEMMNLSHGLNNLKDDHTLDECGVTPGETMCFSLQTIFIPTEETEIIPRGHRKRHDQRSSAQHSRAESGGLCCLMM